jgi:hypothetical protein
MLKGIDLEGSSWRSLFSREKFRGPLRPELKSPAAVLEEYERVGSVRIEGNLV